MKRVVSISLGSSQRNNRVETEILGEKFIIERIGTDGDMVKAIGLIRELDGKVDAFGMGGIDLYITAGQRRYAFRDAKKIARAARTTPIVDGTGLKNTLERRVVSQLQETGLIAWEGKKGIPGIRGRPLWDGPGPGATRGPGYLRRSDDCPGFAPCP